jgi:hypothetical protein
MLTCRSIPSTAWAQAREALVFYFSRRHGIANAEDLAQDAIAAILVRDDFEFEKEEDFLRVVYGFAAFISQSAYRNIRKHSHTAFDPAIHDTAGNRGIVGTHKLNPAEMNLLLDQVMQIAKTHLKKQDWETILMAAQSDRAASPELNSPGGANRFRVRLYRARKTLIELTKWRRSET